MARKVRRHAFREAKDLIFTMQTYDIKDSNEHVFAFEVGNYCLSRRQACKIIGHLPAVKILKTPKLFSWLREEVFCEFELSGLVFEVSEPFGDNSRYWIGPKDNAWHPEIDILKEAFVKH